MPSPNVKKCVIWRIPLPDGRRLPSLKYLMCIRIKERNGMVASGTEEILAGEAVRNARSRGRSSVEIGRRVCPTTASI